jgi:hypothetical protein
MNSLNMPGFLPHRLACFLLSVGLITPLMAAQGSAEVVGEVTLLIGQAQLVGADDVVRTVERGQPVRAGDRIETREGGHVHVRFVDGGRLSVRPASRLQIENYSHSATQPQGSAIKFRLDEGVIRSITGTWGEEARERFRLNTPMAAIGIKGTDFVVKSDANATAASVYSGAILLAPLDDCATPLGSCQKGREKLLSADMKGLMLELNRQQGVPQFVAAVDLLASARRPAAGVGIATTVPPVVGVGVGAEARAATGANLDKPIVNEARGRDLVEAATQIAAAQIAAAQSPVVPAPAPLQPQVNELVWARYAWVKDGGLDTLSQTFEQASAAGRESVAFGTAHALTRNASPAGAVLTTTDAAVNFRLAGSSAFFQRNFDLGVEAAKVDNGTLAVDFSRATFATQLGVSSPTLGADSVVASGSIGKDGVMRTTSANATVVGATTLDGKEAGYLFEKNMVSGALRGVTLWGR